MPRPDALPPSPGPDQPAGKGRITMADVGRRAGVHQTTVSLALRNHPSLPESTRKRLRRLAAEMGYEADPTLRALTAYRRGRSPQTETQLAYVTYWHTAEGWRKVPAHLQFFNGARRRAAQLGYGLAHFWLGAPELAGGGLNGVLQQRGIQGIVLASHSSTHDTPPQFDWSELSAVKIDYFPKQALLHNVTNDQRAIVRLAVRKARQAGYRRIGLVMPSWWDGFVDGAWTAGYLIEQHNQPAADRVPMLRFEPLTDQPHRRGDMLSIAPDTLTDWLATHRVEAVISWGPFVRPVLDRLGIRVPQDLAFADIFRAADDDGATAGVQQNCERVGEIAVELLDGRLKQRLFGPPEVPIMTVVEGTWFDGASLPRVVGAKPMPALS